MIRATGRRLLVLAWLLSLALASYALVQPVSAAGVTAVDDNLVTDIVLDPSPSNVLPFNQDVNLSFAYRTTEPGGVRIFARPVTGGDLTPNYAAHGSPVYPTGSGVGAGNFTITTGDVLVDHIRIRMYNADQSVLLFEADLPVHYVFSGATHLISNIALTPQTPNILPFNQNVNVNFAYRTTQLGGVRIFIRPVTGGDLSPNYAAHGSPVHPTGSGLGAGNFTIVTGDVVVDAIRLRMTNADQSILLFEADLPVHYVFSDAANLISDIVLTPETPNIVAHGEDVNVSFTYRTGDPGGVRIFVRPVSGGVLSPNYAAHGSPLYPAGAGPGSGYFTINDGPVIVDHIRIQMTSADQSTLLFEAFLPVYYQFGPVRRSFLPLVIREP